MTMIEILRPIVQYAVIAVVGYLLARDAWHFVRGKKFTNVPAAHVFRGLRPWHFLVAWPTVAIVIGLFYLFYQVPYLDIGWWTTLGGEGNILLGRGSETGALGPIITGLFMALLVLVMPAFVYLEEEAFRQGAEKRGVLANVGSCIVFGLLHLIMGIPIAAALAISAGGGVLMLVYLYHHSPSNEAHWKGPSSAVTNEGTLAAARVHLAYNYTLMVGLALSLLAANL